MISGLPDIDAKSTALCPRLLVKFRSAPLCMRSLTLCIAPKKAAFMSEVSPPWLDIYCSLGIRVCVRVQQDLYSFYVVMGRCVV